MLKHSDKWTDKQRGRFIEIDNTNLLTAKAWRMRENFIGIYDCKNIDEAKIYFDIWLDSVNNTNLKEMKKTAKTIKRHLYGILNNVVHKVSNGIAEGFNAKIQKLNSIANGYGNFKNLRVAILFFNGNLNLFSHD